MSLFAAAVHPGRALGILGKYSPLLTGYGSALQLALANGDRQFLELLSMTS